MAVLEGILREVEIRDFRAIGSLKIPLTRINVVVGRNNTGKTAIIEALAMLLSSFNEYKDFIGNNVLDMITQYRSEPKYLVRINKSYAKISAKLDTGNRITLYILRGLEKPREIEPVVMKGIEQALDQIADSMYREEVSEIEGEIERLKYRIEHYPEDSPIRKRLEEKISIYKRRLDHYFVNRDNILSLLRSRLRNNIMLCTVSLVDNTMVSVHLQVKRHQLPITSFEEEEERFVEEGVRQVRFADLRLQPIYVRMYGEKSLIRRLDDLPVEKVIELVERLRTLIPYFYDYRNGMVVFKFNGRKEVVPIDVVGDGLLALLELFTPSIYGVRINLIEEPELHMHPGFLEKYAWELTGFARKYGIQYVMTTHSLEFLEYLLDSAKQQEMLSEVSIIRLYRLPDGEIDYEVLSGEEAYDELEDIKGDLRGP